MIDKPFMPKATAVWLVENTKISFKQIANFCNLHELEVKGIADGDVATGMQGYDPIDNNQLTKKTQLNKAKIIEIITHSVSSFKENLILRIRRNLIFYVLKKNGMFFNQLFKVFCLQLQ